MSAVQTFSNSGANIWKMEDDTQKAKKKNRKSTYNLRKWSIFMIFAQKTESLLTLISFKEMRKLG